MLLNSCMNCNQLIWDTVSFVRSFADVLLILDDHISWHHSVLDVV